MHGFENDYIVLLMKSTNVNRAMHVIMVVELISCVIMVLDSRVSFLSSNSSDLEIFLFTVSFRGTSTHE